MQLIDNWQSAWEFTSVQSALILATVSGLFYWQAREAIMMARLSS